MKRGGLALSLGLVLQAGGGSALAQPASPPAAREAAIELPPMMVEESISSVPWLYVNVGGTEFLSRCSASTTRNLVEAWLAKMQLVRVLVPPEFLARMDVPSIFVLYTQDLKQTVSAEIQRELQAGDQRGNRVNIAPSMRLSDRDMHASIAYIDETLFDASTMSVSGGHVRYLLNGRVPDLPRWLIDGIERLYRRSDFILEPITLQPLIWHDLSESDALASDPARPRALLPANELFTTDASRAKESRHPRRREARAATQELFVRWAVASNSATRESLWKLAARAAKEPVTEELFEGIFGFGFSELRDRLSDYLPKAVTNTTRLDPGRQPPLPSFEIERASPNEIARVRGEWERLAIGHVQRHLPQVREPYIAQARRTLRRAFDAGDRDQRLLATMGLCEIDSGNEAAAKQYLEPAVLAGVVRPRAYHELARLRFDELRRGASPMQDFSYSELAPVLQPLQRALTQAPPLAEVFVLLALAWARCETSPNTAEFAELESGARLFGCRPDVAYPLALAFARHGRKAEAIAVLDATAGSVTDDATRTAITGLRADLSASQQQPPPPAVAAPAADRP